MSERIKVGHNVTIYKRGKKGIYCAEFHQEGHRRLSLKTTRKTEAMKKAVGISQMLTDGQTIARSNRPNEELTIDQGIEIRMDELRLRGRRKSSKTRAMGILIRMGRYLSARGIDQLKDVSVRIANDYIASRQGECSIATLNYEAGEISRLYAAVNKRGYSVTNPLQDWEDLEVNNVPDKVLSPSQVWEILEAIKAKWKLPVMMLAFAGMRSGRCRDLLVDEIDFESNWIHIVSRQDAPTKTGGTWKVPIHSILRAELEKYEIPDGGFLFRSPPSRKYPKGDNHIDPGTLNDEFKVALEKVGLPVGRKTGFTANSLRHFFKTFSVSSGVPKPYVDSWQGHSQASKGKWNASERYMHIEDKASQDWMATIQFHKP